MLTLISCRFSATQSQSVLAASLELVTFHVSWHDNLLSDVTARGFS